MGNQYKPFSRAILWGLSLMAMATQSTAVERGYQERFCGFDMNRNGIVGEAADCNVCNGGVDDGDADGSAADVIYVSCEMDAPADQPQGNNHAGCGAPGDPCLTLEYAFQTIADGPGDGAEDIICFRNTCSEKNLSPRSDGGGVPGTYLRSKNDSEARDWELPSDPVMLVGWDVDGDKVYPPHDPDHAAVLIAPEVCPDAPNQECLGHEIENPEEDDRRFFQIEDERAIYLFDNLSHVEMAHFTVRDYGRYNLTYNSGFFQLHQDDPSATAPFSPTAYVYVHDVEIHDLNRDSNFNSRSSTINMFGWKASYVAFENLLVTDNGHWFVRGGGGNGATSYGPFRFQDISLIQDACLPPSGGSCDPAEDALCAFGGVCWDKDLCEPAPGDACHTRASTSVKVWGYYDRIEFLDSVLDANFLSQSNLVAGGGARGINARQCTQDWTIRGNELIDFNVPIEITPESNGFCDGKKASDGTITSLYARPVTDIVIDRNLIRHPAPTGIYDVGIALREGGSAFPGQVIGDVTITNNVVTSRQGLEKCIEILAGHDYLGGDPNHPPTEVPGAVRIVNNTCWGPVTTTGAILIGNGGGANQAYLQKNILVRNNVVAGISGSTKNIMTTYAPAFFDAAHNVWDPDTGFRWNSTNGNLDLAGWTAESGDTGATACTPLLLDTDGTYNNGDPRPRDGDVHWLPTDLCAQDAGLDSSAITAVDLDGETRPQGNGWDAGADEAAPPLPEDPPLRFDGAPTGQLPHETTEATLSVRTYHEATCNAATTADVAYADPSRTAMTADVAGTLHQLTVTGLTSGSTVSRFIRCQNLSNIANDDDYTLSFDIETAPVAVASHWSFDDGSGCTAADEAGSGINGTGYNGSLSPNCPADGPSFGAGVEGDALDFDGINDYVEIPHSAPLAFTSSFTAAAWIQPTDFGDSSYGRILAKQRYLGGFGPGYSFYLADRNDSNPVAARSICANIDTSIGCADDDVITLGVWQHVALVFDDGANEVRFYVDGQAVGGFSTGTTLRSSTVPLRIGDRDDLARSFHGAIDEVELWNRALSPTEVSALSAPAGSAPVRSQGSPSGTLPAGTTNATLMVHTDVSASCSVADAPGVSYGDASRQAMTADGSGTIHDLALNNLSDGSAVARYVRCEAAGVPNDDDYSINFQVASLAGTSDSFWPFDEVNGCTAFDAVGTHDGALEPLCPADGPPRIPGIRGGALEFDGSNDYVEVPHHADLDFTSSLSIAAWIRPFGFGDSSYGRILAKQQYGGFFGPGYSFYVADRSDGNPAATRTLCANIDTAIGCADNDILFPGVWQHVAVVFDDTADQVRFYVNGVPQGGFSTPIALRSTSVPLRIGDRDGLDRSFHGAIDEVRIWSRAVAETEIADLAFLAGEAPVRSQGSPAGSLVAGTTTATLSLHTQKPADCSFSHTPGMLYEDMTEVFSTSDDLFHEASVPVTDDELYRFFVRCDDRAGNANPDDFEIAFSVGFHPTDLADVVFFVESRHGLTLSHGSDLADFENYCERNVFAEGCVRRWEDQSGYVRPGRPDFVGRDFGQDDADKPGLISNCINGWPCVRGGSKDLSPNLSQDFTFEIEASDHVRDISGAFSIYLLTRPVVQTSPYAYFGFAGSNLFHQVVDDSLTLKIDGTSLPVTGPGALVADGSFHLIEIHRNSANQIRLWVDGIDQTTGTPVIPGNLDFSYLFSEARMSNMFGDMAAFLLVEGPLGTAEVETRDYFATVYGVPGPAVPVPPVRSAGSPTGTLPAGTTTVTLSLRTHIPASCNATDVPGVDYSDPSRQAMTADAAGTLHTLDVIGLLNGDALDSYIRCEAGGLANPDDYVISFQIANSGGGPDSSWPFDEANGCTAFDALGGKDGTLSPACSGDEPNRIAGVSGGALDFDGSNDYVEVPHHADLAFTSSFTVAAWIRPVDFGDGGYGRILAKQRYIGGFGPGYSFYVGDQPSGNPASVRTLCANIDTAIGCADNDSLALGVWQHVALVFDDDANEVRFYVDGQPRGGFASSTALRSSTVPLRIGDRDDLIRSFRGAIDEVNLWGRALSGEEISQLPAIVVTTLTDTIANDGETSLREAIEGINNGTYAPGSAVVFETGLQGTIRLDHPNGTLLINESLGVFGDGRVEISGDANGDGTLTSADISLVEIDVPGGTVQLSGLTLTGGWGHGADIGTGSAGGGIFVRHGSVEVDDCHFENHRADLGAALASHDLTDVVVRNSVFTNNQANTFAGAIVNNRATMTIEGSQFTGNSSGFNAGAIYNLVGVSMTIRNSSIAGNQASFHFGGILNTLGVLSIDGSTISGNTANRVGGGLGSIGGTMNVTHSTLSGNSSLDAVNGGGGGVYVSNSAAVTILHSTLANNSATAAGGGIQVLGSTLDLGHTLLAGNTAPVGEDVDGSIVSLGYNLFAQTMVTGSTATDLTTTAASLGPLADNGGATLTHLPNPGSPAIDAGDPTFAPPPAEDQRGGGFSRLLDGDGDSTARIDIGAVEVGS